VRLSCVPSWSIFEISKLDAEQFRAIFPSLAGGTRFSLLLILLLSLTFNVTFEPVILCLLLVDVLIVVVDVRLIVVVEGYPSLLHYCTLVQNLRGNLQ
jgi:hypothetical protein